MTSWIINAHALPPSQGGGTRHYSIAKTLIEDGDNPILIANDNHYAYGRKTATKAGLEVLEGVPFFWVPAPAYSSNSVQRVLNHVIFAHRVARLRPSSDLAKPDVIVGSSPHFWSAWAAERLAGRLGVPFVMEIRDFWPESLVNFGGVPESHPVVRWMRRIEPRLYGNASRIISLLSRASEYLSGFGVSEEKVVWVPNGIDLGMAPAPTPIPEQTPFRVMYSGAHGVANGLDLLVEAARLLPSGVEVELVGEGPLKESLRSQAAGVGNVRFSDAVPKSQIFEKLLTADAFVTLAVNAPVFKWGISPNKIFDYLAMARPTIFAGHVPDSPVELAGGIVTDTTPASIAAGIVRAFEMPRLDRQAMADLGRRYVEEHHDMQVLARRFGSALRDVVV